MGKKKLVYKNCIAVSIAGYTEKDRGNIAEKYRDEILSDYNCPIREFSEKRCTLHSINSGNPIVEKDKKYYAAVIIGTNLCKKVETCADRLSNIMKLLDYSIVEIEEEEIIDLIQEYKKYIRTED